MEKQRSFIAPTWTGYRTVTPRTTEQIKRWKARGQGLTEKQRSELLAEVEKKRYERHRQEQERFEATAKRLSGELGSLSFSDVEKTRYHAAKGIAPLRGAPGTER